ncbi:hypothetical protein BD410DRAFT_788166 [Rickenella mellea]|uniref:Uncharacterized protein n=1 Tax=Rickenella mellea TaxID=50990 RepID=A0A4Y7Q685_9AGAM|nr:hypothetical protein BD410DRAFT_788166 [Rickenella mellea]
MLFTSFFALAALAISAFAAPIAVDEVALVARGNAAVNPNAVTGTTCTAKGTKLDDHSINVALLSICGSIAGTIEKCEGNPTSTTGASGDAKFSIQPQTAGATINVSKGRWEGCVRAARATCGDSPFTTTCIGGASKGNLAVTLAAA